MKLTAVILIALLLLEPAGAYAVQTPSPREVSAAGQSEDVFKSQIKSLADRQRKVNRDMSERLQQIEKQNPELALQYKGQIKKLRAAQKRMGLAAESLEKKDLEKAFDQQTQFFQEATYIFVEGVNYFREEKEKQAMPLGTFLDRQGDQVHYPKEKKMTLGQKPFFDAEKFKPSDVLTHSYKEIEDSDSDKQSHLEVPEFGKPKIFGQKPDSEPQKKASGAEEGSQGEGGLRSKTASMRKPASGALSPESAGSEKEAQKKPGDKDALKSGRTEAADDLNAKNADVKAGGGGAGAGAGAGGGDGGMMPQGDGMLPDGKGQNPSLQMAAGWVPPGSAGAGNALQGSPSGGAALSGGLAEAKGNLTGGTSAGLSSGSSPLPAGSGVGMGSGGLTAGSASGGGSALQATAGAGTSTAGSGNEALLKKAGGPSGTASSGKGSLQGKAAGGMGSGTAQKQGSGSSQAMLESVGKTAASGTPGSASGGGLGNASQGRENAPLAKTNTAAETAGGAGSGYALSGSLASAGTESRTSSGTGQKAELGTLPTGTALLDQGSGSGKALAQGEAQGKGTIDLLEQAAKITGGQGLQDAAGTAGSQQAKDTEGTAGRLPDGGLVGDSKAKEKNTAQPASKTRGAVLPGSTALRGEKSKPSGQDSKGASPAGDSMAGLGKGQSTGLLPEALKGKPSPGLSQQKRSGSAQASAGQFQEEKALNSSIAREDTGLSPKPKKKAAGQGLAMKGKLQKKGGFSGLTEDKTTLQGMSAGGIPPQGASAGNAGTLGTAQTDKSAGASSQDKKKTLNPQQNEMRTSGDSRGPERRGLASSGIAQTESSSSGTSGLAAGDGGPMGAAGGQSGSGFPGGANASGPGLQPVPPAETELFQDNLKSGPPQAGSSAGQKDNTSMPQTLRTEQTAVQPKDERAREANNVAAIHEWLLQERLLIQELKKFKPVKQVNNPNPPWEFYLLRQKQMLNQIRQLRRRIEFYGTKDEYFMELHKVSKIANRLLELLNAGEFTDYAIAGTSLEDLLEDIRMVEAALPPAEGKLFTELSAPEQRVPDSYKPVVSRYFERLSRQ